jgi:hypothetical protein
MREAIVIRKKILKQLIAFAWRDINKFIYHHFYIIRTFGQIENDL